MCGFRRAQRPLLTRDWFDRKSSQITAPNREVLEFFAHATGDCGAWESSKHRGCCWSLCCSFFARFVTSGLGFPQPSGLNGRRDLAESLMSVQSHLWKPGVCLHNRHWILSPQLMIQGMHLTLQGWNVRVNQAISTSLSETVPIKCVSINSCLFQLCRENMRGISCTAVWACNDLRGCNGFQTEKKCKGEMLKQYQ